MAEQTLSALFDLSKIENMQCICGNENFYQIANLKWLSPIQIGNPNGGQVVVQKFMCTNPGCSKIYEKALPPDEVEKLYGGEKKPDGVGIFQNEEVGIKNHFEAAKK